jgi:hypothetical protein
MELQTDGSNQPRRDNEPTASDHASGRTVSIDTVSISFRHRRACPGEKLDDFLRTRNWQESVRYWLEPSMEATLGAAEVTWGAA